MLNMYVPFLPEGQTGEVWKSSKGSAVSEIWKHRIEMYVRILLLHGLKLILNTS